MRRCLISFDDGSMNHICEADLPAVGEVARASRAYLEIVRSMATTRPFLIVMVVSVCASSGCGK